MDKGEALNLVAGFRFQMRRLADAQSGIAGEEVLIPTRSGRRRALVYRPKGGERQRPAYIDFHPGGFVSGGPEVLAEFNRRICDELGIVVVAPSYRLAPEAMYPADKEDALDIVLHLLDNSHAYGIDPDRVAIGGHSAGGNIVASLALQLKDSPLVNFACVLLDYPALDLDTDAWMKPQPQGCIDPRIASMFDALYRDPKFGRDIALSPVFASSDDLAGLPPHVVITAEGDSLRKEAEEYAAHLMSAGVEVMGRRFLGVQHGFTIGTMDTENGAYVAAQQAIDLMMRGLRMYLIDDIS